MVIFEDIKQPVPHIPYFPTLKSRSIGSAQILSGPASRGPQDSLRKNRYL